MKISLILARFSQPRALPLISRQRVRLVSPLPRGAMPIGPSRQAGPAQHGHSHRLWFRDVRGYTNGMKTAISLPDDVFREAERHAKRTRKSRSQLYAEALAEYLARHAPDEVTERMNQVLDELGGLGVDPFLDGAARRVLKDVEW